jgi:hypothetical protein
LEQNGVHFKQGMSAVELKQLVRKRIKATSQETYFVQYADFQEAQEALSPVQYADFQEVQEALSPDQTKLSVLEVM